MSQTDPDLIKNLHIKPTDRVLDIGGSMKQHQIITVDTLIDIIRPEEAPYGRSKLLAKNFVKVDITKEKLPFKDKEFDICLCTHVLEDLPTPFPIISEMIRVAKRGYITTPSMGRDFVFSHFNLTDWMTGARRVPGWSHHKWLFYVKHDNKVGDIAYILPKNYGLLYSSEFHFVKWSGEEEFQYTWKGDIKYKEISDLNIRALADEYRKYIKINREKLTKGIPLIYLDNPIYFFKEFIKILLNRREHF